jgi:hypothetical protein
MFSIAETRARLLKTDADSHQPATRAPNRSSAPKTPAAPSNYRPRRFIARNKAAKLTAAVPQQLPLRIQRKHRQKQPRNDPKSPTQLHKRTMENG